MWKYKNSIITEATPEAIWKLYNNVDKWKKWDDIILEVKINGPFEEGVTGDLTLLGQEPLLFTLTEVKENKLFNQYNNSRTVKHSDGFSSRNRNSWHADKGDS